MDEQIKILKGILYNALGDLGPEAKAHYPKSYFDLAKLNIIPIKTITLLTGEEGRIPEKLSIIPFTKYQLLAIIHHFEVIDEKSRGGVVDSNITVLFDEKYSSIAYKYSEQFEPILKEVAKKINECEQKKQKLKIEQLLSELYQTLLKNLSSLKEAEKKAISRIKEKKPDFRVKIVVIGDAGVGKTTMLLRYVDDAFQESYLPTIGVNISNKDVEVNNKKIRLNIYDIAGQDKFELTRRIFYEGLEGVLIVFDLTNQDSFLHLENWFDDVSSAIAPKKIKGLLIGNKLDLAEKRKISKLDADLIATKFGLNYIEISAKTGNHLKEAFRILAEILLRDS
ncbi:MAG: Rab family GTPase [Candidatus Helarchaeota archaeon]